jgi:RNA 2',3'-cyclic 3'-phosphodiesterase
VRLFTGIAIGGDVMERLGRLLRELRPLAPLNWSPLENLHITTKFIGAWPEERLEELTRALAAIKLPAVFPLRIARLGYLPNAHKPLMLFAGVHGGPELVTLATRMEYSLESLGVVREQRRYTPHVTLARVRGKSVSTVREHIANMQNLDFGTFPVYEFHLYSSQSGSYEILATFPLGSHS